VWLCGLIERARYNIIVEPKDKTTNVYTSKVFSDVNELLFKGDAVRSYSFVVFSRTSSTWFVLSSVAVSLFLCLFNDDR
jgi:hypothetical protein